MNIKCRKCGAETPDYARYCVKCGAEVDDMTAPRDTITYISDDGGESPVYTNFGGAIRLFFKNYVNFSGRSTRSEYWYAYLFIVLVNIALEIFKKATGISILRTVWDLVIFVPLMSAGFRRLHDIGRSGTMCVSSMVVLFIWAFVSGIILGVAKAGRPIDGLVPIWVLLGIATLILGIYLIVLLCQPSLINHNSYGRDPY